MTDVLVVLAIAVVGAGVIFMIAHQILEANDHFDLSKAIGRGIAQGLVGAIENASATGGAFDKVIDKTLRERAMENVPIKGDLPALRFIWEMAFEFMRVDRDMSATEAKGLSLNTLRDFLRDEKIKFGAADYAWDQSAAVTLARECEIDHWEASHD